MEEKTLTKAVGEMVQRTWNHDSRSRNLGGLKVKHVYAVNNEALLKQYQDGRRITQNAGLPVLPADLKPILTTTVLSDLTKDRPRDC